MPDANGLTVKLLGPPALFWQGETVPLPPPKTFALLAYVALSDHGVTREELSRLLWHGKLHSVRQALYALRGLPGAGTWLQEEGAVHVHATCDVHAVRDAVLKAQYAQALDLLGEAPLLSGLDVREAPAFEDWLEEARDQLRALAVQAAGQLARQAEAEQRLPDAITALERLVQPDPLTEESHRALMRVLARAGRIEDALAAFERLRQLLRSEVNAEPDVQTLTLLKSLEEGGSARATHALLVRTAQDLPVLQDPLVGREGELEQIGALLSAHRRVLVQGLGGVGKTALAAQVAVGHVQGGGQVLWLEVGDDGPETVFDALARPFGAHSRVARGTQAERAHTLALTLQGAGVTLLVLDDVWNAYTVARVREALPGETGLLITSRQRYPGWPRVTVPRLGRAAALSVLRHAAPHLPATDSRADALCALLGDHPFAVRLAGLQLQQEQQPAGHLLTRLQAAPHDLNVQGEGSVPALLAESVTRLSDPAHEAFWALGGCSRPPPRRSCWPGR